MKVVFLGTPDFAVPSLEALIEKGYNVAGVFTQPDRPAKRGHKLSFSPVKECAVKYGIDVYQFEKIRQEEGVRALKELEPDIMITVAFGQILSKEILDIPKYGCINVHGSLLPKYRGAAPIQWAIINGETTTGVTSMYTDVGLDTGDILLQKEMTINKDETSEDIFERMAPIGAKLLIETLEKIESGDISRIPQNEVEASYFPMLKKETGHIDFNKTASEIHNLVRGVSPWPGAYFLLGKDIIKVLKVKPLNDFKHEGKPGEVLVASAKAGLIVACKDGAVEIIEIKAPSGKQMNAKSYITGNKLEPKTVLE